MDRPVFGNSNVLTLAGSGTQTITTNGKTFAAPLTLNGTGTTFRIVDPLTMPSTRAFTLTSGTLDLNGNEIEVFIDQDFVRNEFKNALPMMGIEFDEVLKLVSQVKQK